MTGPQPQIFQVGIKALIMNELGQVLVMQSSLRDHGKGAVAYWDIPGGRIDEGGTIIETLKREMEEETGITNLLEATLFDTVISSHRIPLKAGGFAALFLAIYTVKIPSDSKIRLSPEHVAHEWVSPAEAAKRLTNKYPAEFTDKLTAL